MSFLFPYWAMESKVGCERMDGLVASSYFFARALAEKASKSMSS